MAKIETPLGQIQVFFDGQPIKYIGIKLENDVAVYPDVAGRFKIEIEYKSDLSNHSIYCKVDNLDREVHGSPESGERLEANAFYIADKKLTVAAEGDAYYIDNTRYSDYQYDYDVSYLDDGLQYDILPFTKSQIFVFGISWINSCTIENDHQTWFAADPTLM